MKVKIIKKKKIKMIIPQFILTGLSILFKRNETIWQANHKIHNKLKVRHRCHFFAPPVDLQTAQQTRVLFCAFCLLVLTGDNSCYSIQTLSEFPPAKNKKHCNSIKRFSCRFKLAPIFLWINRKIATIKALVGNSSTTYSALMPFYLVLVNLVPPF